MDRPESGGLDEVLAHYGVPGMKWGVRKRAGGSSSPQDVKVRPFFGNRFVRTTGGKKLPLSDDATRAAVSRQKAKKSNVRSLSTKELQDLVNRMNLEQQYSSLEKKRIDRGRQTAKDVIGVATEVAKAVKDTRR